MFLLGQVVNVAAKTFLQMQGFEVKEGYRNK
jgi:hypothetical protein